MVIELAAVGIQVAAFAATVVMYRRSKRERQETERLLNLAEYRVERLHAMMGLMRMTASEILGENENRPTPLN